MFLWVTLSFTSSKHVPFFSLSSVTISTSVSFDGLLVTGLYTSTPVQSAPIPAPAAFGFGESCFFCQYKLLFFIMLFSTSKPSDTPRSVCWDHGVLRSSSVIHIRSQTQHKATSLLWLWQVVMDEESGWCDQGFGQMGFHWCLREQKKNWIWDRYEEQSSKCRAF